MWKKRNALVPFRRLYRLISPSEFVQFFGSELPQISAFILSFCPRKSFIKKVIKLFDEAERDTYAKDIHGYEMRTSWTIREYLNRCAEETVDQEFVRKVETRVNTMLQGFEDGKFLRRFCMEFNLKHPKILRDAYLDKGLKSRVSERSKRIEEALDKQKKKTFAGVP